MQFKNITSENWPTAVALLCEGFPERDAEFWHNGLQRWADLSGDPFAGPIGYLTHDKKGNANSVLLTFRAPPTWNSTEQINFSSWYVKEASRMFAPLMLKRISDDVDKTFTDFTPSASVQQMLRRLKYSEYSAQHLGYWTPRLAMGHGKAVVDAKVLEDHLGDDPDLLRALRDHQKLGCIVVGLQTPEGIAPLVLRVKRRKRVIKCAEIIYCHNVSILPDNMVGIARHLLKHGILILEGEFPDGAALPNAAFDWGPTARFVKGDWQADRIDYLYSEVPVLGV